MKRLLTLTLLLTLLLAACREPQPRYTIGISQCSDDNWRDKFNEELRTAALISDSATVRILTAGDNDTLQSAQIDSLVESGIDLLVVSPNRVSTVTPALQRAHQRGIPVILYDRKSSFTDYTAFIGCDNYEIGRAMATYIAARLHGRGRVAEITGLQGSSPAIERHRGFTDALRDYPHVQLVASEPGDWKRESGHRAMQRILSATHELDYVFAHNDRMALGARDAALRAGLTALRYTGVDAQASGGMRLVRDSVLDASYIYPTKGNEVLRLAFHILEGRPYQRDNFLQASIVTHDNAALILMEANDAELQRSYLAQLHQQVDSYVAHLHSQRSLTVALALAAVLLVAIVLIVYRSLLVKAEFNNQLAQSNAKLKKANEDVYHITHSRLTFFTNVSHELRTPLTLILDPVERLLGDHTIKGANRDLLFVIKRNATALQQLVNTILDLRKIQNGMMPVSTEQVDLPMLLRQWVDDFTPTADRKRIRLAVETEAFTPSPIVTDTGKLARIVFNLVSNALKFTPPQGHVTIALADLPDPARFLLSVTDDGAGIAHDDMAKVFERFFQARGAATGTGIGLAVVKSHTELLGGTVTLNSREGQGTEFRIDMPRTVEGTPASQPIAASQQLPSVILPDNEPAAEPAPLPFAPGDDEKHHLLLIDDNDDVRRYLRALLADNYFIIEAANGQEGLDKARQHMPDLVVCDVMMPVMDGLEFCRRLKSGTATSHIPVILLTAKALDDQKAEGYHLGADSYLTKPFHTKVLLARIDNLLRQRAQLRQLYAQPQADIERSTLIGQHDKAFLRQLHDTIDRHLADNRFNVESIGQEMRLSRVQLYRKTKALTGCSVVDLLRKARLARARHLLLTTRLTVSEVAYDTGFSAPSYFTKCFKDEYGITPGECAGKECGEDNGSTK